MSGKSKIHQSGRKIESIFILTFVLIFASLSFAQTTTQTKIAVIFPEAFKDKKTGIKELADAYDKLEEEFKAEYKELKSLSDQVTKLYKEIISISERAFDRPTKLLGETVSEYRVAWEKFEKRRNEIKPRFDKRESEVTKDIYKKIGEALKQYAAKKDYQAIFDVTKLELVSFDNDLDVTQDFIKYYNENFGNTKTQ